MTSSYDAIVIGAGHNGLVCANYLAQAGKNVLLLEKSMRAGGLAAAIEFHPGFSLPVAHSVNHFMPKVAEDLKLAEHGLEWSGQPPSLTALDPDGNHIRLKGDELEGCSAEDLETWSRYYGQLQKFATALEPFWLKTMPRIGYHGLPSLLTFGQLGLKIRMLGRQDMRELLRIMTLPTRDLMDEFFETPLLKAMLSWDGLIGSRMAPRSPNNALVAMLYRMAGALPGQPASPVGGPGALVGALVRSAEAAGVDVRLGSGVRRIVVEPGSDGLVASGVELQDGTEVKAAKIISSADPKTTFGQLVGVDNLEIGFSNRIRRLRSNGLVAKLHVALDALPTFTGLEDCGGRLLIAPDMDAIEFAFDHSKYGEYSKEPVMELSLPSLQDASLAPGGQHVLSAHVMYAPTELRDGWTFEARSNFVERCLATIERYAPGIRDQVLGHELLTPADIETQFSVAGGHWHHGELALDQMLMMRPTYEAAQYSTPLPGLYLCGAGCHPAGDLTGAAGHNAAREVLK